MTAPISATKIDSKPITHPSPTLAPPTEVATKPTVHTSGGKSKATNNASKAVAKASPAPDPEPSATQMCRVGGELDTSHETGETHQDPAGVDQPTTTNDHAQTADDPSGGLESLEPPPTTPFAKPLLRASGWLELRIWAEMLHDAQKSRIAASNRGERGGVDPEVYRWHVEQLEAVEHGVALAMRRTYRRVVPAELVAWQKAERGIGEHLLARLLGHLGDPYVATPHAWLETPPEGHVCEPRDAATTNTWLPSSRMSARCRSSGRTAVSATRSVSAAPA